MIIEIQKEKEVLTFKPNTAPTSTKNGLKNKSREPRTFDEFIKEQNDFIT